MQNDSKENKTSKIPLIISTSLISIAITAIGIYTFNSDNADSSEVNTYKEASQMNVDVLELKNENVQITSSLEGRVSAFEKAEIRPQINGIVEKKLFKDGSYVKANQPLFKIDDSVYKAELKIAEAALNYATVELKLAQKKRDRYKNLVEQKAVSVQDFDNTQAEFEKLSAIVLQRKADYDLSKIKLDYTVVKSPIDGHVDISLVTIGELVVANQPKALTNVTNSDKVYIDINQPYGEYISDNNKEVISTRQAFKNIDIIIGNSDKAEVGMLISTGKIIDKNTGSIKMRAIADNESGLLIDGLYVKTNIYHGIDSKGIIIPQSNIARISKKLKPDDKDIGEVKIVSDGVVKTKKILISGEISIDNKDYYLVHDGVEAGDLVITDGSFKVEEGDNVTFKIINKGGENG